MVAKGKVEIQINVDDKASKKMKQIGINADKMAKGFAIAGAGMMAVGVGIIAGLGKLVNSYSKAGDEVAKMAKRTGISTIALSEMRHVANITGTSLDSFEKGIKKMAKSLVDADAGLETYIRSFRRIGLEVSDLMAMRPEDQFWAIANAIGAMEDPTLRAATAQEIFGRAGTLLLPMMAETGEAIADLRQEAHDLNLVFDEEAAAAAEAFEDSKTRLQGALTGIGNTIAEAVMPQFEEFINMMEEKLKPAMAWLEEHPEIVESFLKFGAIFAVTGAVFLGLAAFIKLMQFTLIPTIIKAVVAFIALQAAAGPAGWAILAGSVAVAALAIAGLNKLMSSFDLATESDLPSLEHGGIVPGPTGQPVPIMAHGGEAFAGVGNSLGGINITIGNFMGDESSLRSFSRKVQEIMGQDSRRTSFAGINRLGYMAGSSSI